jgi:hypothetical protein
VLKEYLIKIDFFPLLFDIKGSISNSMLAHACTLPYLLVDGKVKNLNAGAFQMSYVKRVFWRRHIFSIR